MERFWGTLWRECLESAIFQGLDEARVRIAHFIDHYNFLRPHQGIDGLVPADRFFEATPQVRKALAAQVKANALELARDGEPRKPLYLAGRIGETPVSLHTEGGKVILSTGKGDRQEVDLGTVGDTTAGNGDAPPPPGTSPLDAMWEQLRDVAAANDEDATPTPAKEDHHNE